MTTANEFLQNSDKLLGDRGKEYDPNGQQERSMGKIVQVFNTISGKELTEAEGWLFMTCLKQVRLFNKPGFHKDSAEDLISYAALLAEAKEGDRNKDIKETVEKALGVTIQTFPPMILKLEEEDDPVISPRQQCILNFVSRYTSFSKSGLNKILMDHNYSLVNIEDDYEYLIDKKLIKYENPPDNTCLCVV